ncbi:hypothetical protein SLA2020_277310 [Shorea laevis]
MTGRADDNVAAGRHWAATYHQPPRPTCTGSVVLVPTPWSSASACPVAGGSVVGEVPGPQFFFPACSRPPKELLSPESHLAAEKLTLSEET